MDNEFPTCPYCNSDKISRDASAVWHEANQEWCLRATYDTFTCDDCGKDFSNANWKPVKYNCMCIIAFEVTASDKEGETLTATEFKEALMERIDTLNSEGDLAWIRAVSIEGIYKQSED